MSGDVTAAIERLRDAYEKSTQGEWEAGHGWVFTLPVYEDSRSLSNVLGMKFADPERAKAEMLRGNLNAEFIAAAHNLLPTVLAEVEILRAEVAQQSIRADEAETWDVRRGDNPIEQENARLRAEREALLKRTTCRVCWAEVTTADPEADQ